MELEQRRTGVHEITVEGVWHNDSTAGVFVWCDTCGDSILEGDEFGDRLTPDQINEAVAAHLGKVRP